MATVFVLACGSDYTIEAEVVGVYRSKESALRAFAEEVCAYRLQSDVLLGQDPEAKRQKALREIAAMRDELARTGKVQHEVNHSAVLLEKTIQD